MSKLASNDDETTREIELRVNGFADALPVCQWRSGDSFSVFKNDPSDLHAAWFVVLPDGSAIEFNHHSDDAVDKARAQFVADACNAAMKAIRARSADEKGGGK